MTISWPMVRDGACAPPHHEVGNSGRSTHSALIQRSIAQRCVSKDGNEREGGLLAALPGRCRCSTACTTCPSRARRPKSSRRSGCFPEAGFFRARSGPRYPDRSGHSGKAALGRWISAWRTCSLGAAVHIATGAICEQDELTGYRPNVAEAFGAGMNFPSLFSPLKVGRYHLKHRVMLAPLTRMRAAKPSLAPRPLNAEYYAQRATPGGLLIAEASPVMASGFGSPGVPGIYTQAQVAGWREVVDAVHARGGIIFLQLWHVG